MAQTNYDVSEVRLLMSPQEFAGIVGRTRRTVYSWMSKGLVEAVRMPDGRRAIHRDELARILSEGTQQRGRAL